MTIRLLSACMLVLAICITAPIQAQFDLSTMAGTFAVDESSFYEMQDAPDGDAKIKELRQDPLSLKVYKDAHAGHMHVVLVYARTGRHIWEGICQPGNQGTEFTIERTDGRIYNCAYTTENGGSYFTFFDFYDDGTGITFFVDRLSHKG